jgi:hypothetical protein
MIGMALLLGQAGLSVGWAFGGTGFFGTGFWFFDKGVFGNGFLSRRGPTWWPNKEPKKRKPGERPPAHSA